MTPADEHEIRARFRHADLPAAPASLRTAVEDIVTTPARRRFGPVPNRMAQALLPVAGVVVIVVAAVLGGGSANPPHASATDQPVVSTPASTPGEHSGGPIPFVACDDLAEDVEPALDCETAVGVARAALSPDHPPIAELRFVHACWSTGSDGVRGCAPQMVGVVTVRFVGHTDVVRFGISRSGQTWRAAEIPRVQPVEDLDLSCKEVERPALTCAEIRDAVLDALGPNHPPVSHIGVSTICSGSQIPTCGRYNQVDVDFAEPRPFMLPMFIRDGPHGQALVFDERAPLQESFGPDYPVDGPVGPGPWVWRAELSEDRRVLSIQFFGDAGLDDRCLVDYEPWVGFEGNSLLVKLAVTVPPSPVPSVPERDAGEVFACISAGRPYVFNLALPEPYTGSVVRDLNGWVLSLTP